MKKVWLFVFIILICLSMGTLANAQTQSVIRQTTSTQSENQPTPRADVIETKFRLNNGVRQYRRWNATRLYWVDPFWINV